MKLQAIYARDSNCRDEGCRDAVTNQNYAEDRSDREHQQE